MSVPKIIHQLWIGQRPAPLNAMKSIKQMNPDYEYMFWNEELIKDKLFINPRYQRKLEEHNAIWGKADMYRYLILEQFGGVFVDADMIAIEPLDDFLLSKGFFCWENETERKNLCATSFQGYPPHHEIPTKAIEWIMNNNVKDTKTPSWELVGPGLLTRVYHTLLTDKESVNVFPSYYALPDHHTGTKYHGHGKVYMSHEWGSTYDKYKSINEMSIPTHHTIPNNSIEVHIPKTTNNKLLKDIMKGIKTMNGHFNIIINYDGDLSKYLKSMRFVSQKTIPNIECVIKDKYEIMDNNRELTLTEIMNEEGSDKGKGRHDYTKKYEELFNPMKDLITNFCEIGLGSTNPNIKSNMGTKGIPLASVKGWKRYFTNAIIYGGDIDKEILKNEDRLYCNVIDMTDKESILSFWNNYAFKMDIILDDGLHEYDANVTLFENSSYKFNHYYIIEDIGSNYIPQWKTKLNEWKLKYPQYDFELFINPIPTNSYDNNMIVIKNKGSLILS